MATPQFCCGFECGISTGSATTDAQHWFLQSGASFNTNASFVRSGLRSLRLNCTAATANATNRNSGAGAWAVGANTLSFGFHIYFTTLPNATIDVFSILIGSVVCGVYFNSSDNKLYAGTAAASLGSTGVLISTGRWYRIDVKIVSSATPYTVDVKVDGVTCGQATSSTAANTFSQVNFGSTVTTYTTDYYVDDFIVGTGADYPIFPGKIFPFVPTSDGTHTATTTTIVKGTIASPTGGGNVAGSTDVFNWVNGVPLLGGATDNTRLVNHQTAGTTLYAEVIFGPAPGILTPKYGPRAVEVITADREASTATGDFTVKINDNGTESTVIARGVVAGSTSDRYATKQFPTPPTGGSWGVASGAGNFNNLRARFGYASDATPDQYWRGIMVEAEFAEWPQKITQVKQAVNRSNNY